MADNIVSLRRMGSPATLNGYIQGVRRFVEYLGLRDPEEALEKIKNGEIDTFAALDNQGDGFIDKSLERYAHRTVRSFLFGIKKWLDLGEVKLEWGKVEFPTTTMIQETDRAPTREELRRILNHASLRDRVAVAILASSGLRVGTLLSLTWGDVCLDYPDVARISVTSRIGRKFSRRVGNGSGGRFYATFITPEAKRLLLEYRRYRESNGEEIRPGSPLIEYNGKSITLSAFEHKWAALLAKAGLAERAQRWHKLHLHTLRKFFRSNCIGVDPSYREFWMGHRGGYLDESYFRADEGKHLEEYRKVIGNLSIMNSSRNLSREEVRAEVIAALIGKIDDAELAPIAQKLGITQDQIRAMLKRIRREGVAQEDEALLELERKLRGEALRNDENCNQYESKLITEEELPDHINVGWILVKELSSRKILVKRRALQLQSCADY